MGAFHRLMSRKCLWASVLWLSTVSVVFAGDYRVGHLPMIEKHGAYVLCGDENIWQELVRNIEPEKRQFLVRVNPGDTAKLQEMVVKPGPRFVLLNLSRESFPRQPDMIKLVEGKRNVAQLPQKKAGYFVKWSWKVKKQPDQMWVVVYAPGAMSLARAIRKACDDLGWKGKGPSEPAQEWDVALWTVVGSADLLKEQRLQEWIARSFNRDDIDAEIVPLNLVEAARERLSTSNQCFLITHAQRESLVPFLRESASPVADMLGNLKENELAVVTAQLPENRRLICMSAGSVPLYGKLLRETPNVLQAVDQRWEVPNLSWINRVALVPIVQVRDERIPPGAIDRMMTAITKGLQTYVRVANISPRDMQVLAEAEARGMLNLPGGAKQILAQTEVKNVDALLIVSINAVRANGAWRTGKPVLPEIPPDPDLEEPWIDKTRCLIGGCWGKSKVHQEKCIPSWADEHRRWRAVIGDKIRLIEATAYTVYRTVEWVEEAQIEVSLRAICTSEKKADMYGYQIEGTIVASAPTSTQLLVMSGKQEMRVYPRVYRESINRDGPSYGGERYLGIRFVVRLPDPEFPPLPPRFIGTDSPLWTEAFSRAADNALSLLLEQALWGGQNELVPAAEEEKEEGTGSWGIVQNVTGSQLTVRWAGDQPVAAGEWIEIHTREGGLPKAKVVSVAGTQVVAELHQPDNRIQIGDAVYRSAPPPPGDRDSKSEPPAARTGSENLPSIVRVKQEVVIKLALTKQPPRNQESGLQAKALVQASKELQKQIQQQYRVLVSLEDLSEIASVSSARWEPKVKQYIVKVRFAGEVKVRRAADVENEP